jgi:AcrR family transcriptional regulator
MPKPHTKSRKTRPPAPARSRDRNATEQTLLEAAKTVLAEEGFRKFGVNAVARRAGCDKQLIYRYFGGLDGLLDRIGAELADWLRQSLRPLAALGRPASYAELVERLMLGFFEALRADALVQRIAAWEVAENSPLTRRLAAARGKALSDWVRDMRGDLAPPAGVDAAAANAFVIAAIQHLVLASAAGGQFSGMALRNEVDWERVRETVRLTVRALYAPSKDR